MRGKKIFDEFTDLNVSHQRKSQLRNQKKGLCSVCGQPAFDAIRCTYHLRIVRQHNFKYRGVKIRKNNTRYGNSGDSVEREKTLKERILNEMVI